MITPKPLTRRAVLLAGVGLTMSSLIAGCTGPSATTSSGPITLEYWDLINPANDDPRGRDLAANIASFEAANPNVKIKVNTLPWANIDPKLMQAANAGNSPDVVRVLDTDLPKHVAAGNVLPLDELIPEDEKKDWLLGWESLTFDGKKMALPLEYRSEALYYRTDFVGGDKPPVTWDDMLASAEAAEAKGRSGVIVGLSSGAQAATPGQVFVSYIWAEGGEVFHPDGKAAFNSPEGVRAFERFGSLVKKGVTPEEVVSYAYEDVYQSITAGASDFALLGSHRYATAVAASAGGANLKLAPLPGIDGSGPAPAHVFGWTVALGKDSKHPEEAAKFMRHMTSAESQLARVQKTGELPTRDSVYNDPWFATPEGASANTLAKWFRSHGRSLNAGEHFVEASQLWAEALQKMVVEGADAKTVADEAAKAYNELL